MRRINLQRCSFGGFGYYRFMCRWCWGMGCQVNRVLQPFTDFRTSPKSASSPTGSESSSRGNVTKETDHRRHDGREWCSFLTNYYFVRGVRKQSVWGMLFCTVSVKVRNTPLHLRKLFKNFRLWFSRIFFLSESTEQIRMISIRI